MVSKPLFHVSVASSPAVGCNFVTFDIYFYNIDDVTYRAVLLFIILVIHIIDAPNIRSFCFRLILSPGAYFQDGLSFASLSMYQIMV